MRGNAFGINFFTTYYSIATTYQKTIAFAVNYEYNEITTGGEVVDIEIKIDSEYKIPKVIILTDNVNEEINLLVARLSEEAPQLISVFRNNELRILEQDEIIRVYSSDGKIIAATDEGEYTLRQRLYEMEERLDSKKFARISNSEIINLKRVKKFDLSFVGTICVTLKDSTVTYVSRRYVSKIKKILGI